MATDRVANTCAYCRSELQQAAELCPNCGNIVPVPLNAPMFATHNDLEGLGGWLILIGIALALGPFLRARGIITDSKFLFDPAYQIFLSTRSGLHVVLFFELVTNSFFFVFLLLLNYLFYKKQRSFPSFMVFNLALQVITEAVDHIWAGHLGYGDDGRTVFGGFAAAAIWIPYMLVSRRVKQTFVD